MDSGGIPTKEIYEQNNKIQIFLYCILIHLFLLTI